MVCMGSHEANKRKKQAKEREFKRALIFPWVKN